MMFYILFLESISGHGSFCVRWFYLVYCMVITPRDKAVSTLYGLYLQTASSCTVLT